MVASEEVEFYWLIVQADFDVGDEDTYWILLHKIIELYLTVRGYSYSRNLIEKYLLLSSLQPREQNELKHFVEKFMMMICNFSSIYDLFDL